MRMLANRQNSRWLEAKEWDVPYTFDATKFPTLLGMCSSQQHYLPLCLLSYQPMAIARQGQVSMQAWTRQGCFSTDPRTGQWAGSDLAALF